MSNWTRCCGKVTLETSEKFNLSAEVIRQQRILWDSTQDLSENNKLNFPFCGLTLTSSQTRVCGVFHSQVFLHLVCDVFYLGGYTLKSDISQRVAILVDQNSPWELDKTKRHCFTNRKGKTFLVSVWNALTFKGRLLFWWPFKENLQIPQDVLLSEEVQDFLCIVLKCQTFPEAVIERKGREYCVICLAGGIQKIRLWRK